MVFWIYFWIYTLAVLIIWWFFIIAKIHSLKFKNYQPKIIKITHIITIILIILTLLGYIIILIHSLNWHDNRKTNDTPNENINENIEDDFSDLSEKDIIPNSTWESYF